MIALLGCVLGDIVKYRKFIKEKVPKDQQEEVLEPSLMAVSIIIWILIFIGVMWGLTKAWKTQYKYEELLRGIYSKVSTDSSDN
jgi:hypothetical protein